MIEKPPTCGVQTGEHKRLSAGLSDDWAVHFFMYLRGCYEIEHHLTAGCTLVGYKRFLAGLPVRRAQSAGLQRL